MKKYTVLLTAILIIFWAILFIILYDTQDNASPVVKTTSESKQIDTVQVTESEQAPAQVNIEQYDVVVVGGDPEGVAAAVSAARNGASTLLIEHRDGLGGLFTYAKMNFLDIVHGVDQKEAVAGIFKEWHNMVGGKIAFDPEQAKKAFLNLVQSEPQLDLWLHTNVEEVIKEGNKLIGIHVDQDGETYTVYAKRFIDSTQDADLAVLAGAPYFVGWQDMNYDKRLMAVTLVLHYKNVDWSGIKKAAKTSQFGYAVANKDNAWGFGDMYHVYHPVEEGTRLRGLNIARVGEDEVYMNALQIFGVDGLDEASINEGLERGEREARHILQWFKEKFPGFEEAEIASIPSELYIRETRHIEAEYQLQMADIWTNRHHWDGIAFGGYPVDVQATSIHDYGYVVSNPTQYTIPFRSLIPKKIDHLLVASRAAGYSSLASGSARIVPTGMAVGEAAGAAAALSIQHEEGFRELAAVPSFVGQLQDTLTNQGALVGTYDLPYPYQGRWFDQSIQYLMNYGLANGGYNNNLHINDPYLKNNFIKRLKTGIYRTNHKLYSKAKEKIASYSQKPIEKNEGLLRDECARILIDIFTEQSPTENVWEQAFSLNLIDKQIYQMLDTNRVLKNKEGYYILAYVLKEHQKQ